MNFTVKENGSFSKSLTLSYHSEILPKEITKAIELKYSLISWIWKEGWKIILTKNKLTIERNFSKKDDIQELIIQAEKILNELLDLSQFEINVAKELLNKGE
ncbi:MAG: hypothetical protein B6I28_01245 [Fusobacteriia bacterium 4572_132]|nr:MAG: hypothetical protein B6I28_01245 [Fusobacteriia bacterium 4572_132]